MAAQIKSANAQNSSLSKEVAQLKQQLAAAQEGTPRGQSQDALLSGSSSGSISHDIFADANRWAGMILRHLLHALWSLLLLLQNVCNLYSQSTLCSGVCRLLAMLKRLLADRVSGYCRRSCLPSLCIWDEGWKPSSNDQTRVHQTWCSFIEHFDCWPGS